MNQKGLLITRYNLEEFGLLISGCEDYPALVMVFQNGSCRFKKGPSVESSSRQDKGRKTKYCGDQGKKKHERRLLVPTLNEMSRNARSESPGVT